MKTLFVTDLDGTLLQEDIQVSKKSFEIIRSLTERGVYISYATARSFYTSSVITKGLSFNTPVVTKNGVFINNADSGEILVQNIFSDEEAEDIYRIIRQNNLYPIVFSYQGDEEKYAYDAENISDGIQWYIDGHKNDSRMMALQGNADILSGEVHYFSCIGTKEMLGNTYSEINKKYRCILSKDTYEDIMWLEIMPKSATKALSVLQLKEMAECDYLVVFGDGINDIPMFKAADESYAVQNAVGELKEIATGIIGANKDDGVAKWLLENYGRY